MMKKMPDGFHTSCANGTGCTGVASMLLGSDIAGKGCCQRPGDQFWPWSVSHGPAGWRMSRCQCCVTVGPRPSAFST
jgi:hypothetical protein